MNQFPAWSPDGQRIAFYSDRDGGGIYTMSVLGGDVRKIVAVKPGVLYTFSLTWAKNGQIVYTNFDAEGNKQLYRVTETNRTPECLTALVGANYGRCGDLSPSGDLLAFLSPLNGDAPLYLGNLRSRRYVQLEQAAQSLRWADQGRRLFFVSQRDGLPDLWTLDVDPQSGTRVGDARRLTSGLNLAEFTPSPDGRKILAVKTKSQSRLWSFPPGAGPYSTLAAGKPLTNEGFTDAQPIWTPDGKDLLFISNRRGPIDLWRLPPAAPRCSSRRAAADKLSKPSPDGRWIAFSATSDQGVHALVMRPGRQRAAFAHPRDEERFPFYAMEDWSPDGGRVVVTIASKEQPWAKPSAAVDRETGTFETR